MASRIKFGFTPGIDGVFEPYQSTLPRKAGEPIISTIGQGYDEITRPENLSMTVG